MILNNILLLHLSFVLIDVFLPNLCDYKFIIIVHVILCLNEREIKKKKREKFGQEDQMLKLTFNFHGALSILTLLKMSSPYSPRKSQRKKKEKKRKKREKRKIKVKRGETKKRKKTEKNFLFEPSCQKSQF